LSSISWLTTRVVIVFINVYNVTKVTEKGKDILAFTLFSEMHLKNYQS
jgi:hypothetical protein